MSFIKKFFIKLRNKLLACIRPKQYSLINDEFLPKNGFRFLDDDDQDIGDNCFVIEDEEKSQKKLRFEQLNIEIDNLLDDEDDLSSEKSLDELLSEIEIDDVFETQEIF